MFDTMTLTKVGGALCGSLLVFLLGNWAAETLYHVGGGGHGAHAQQAYVIDTGEEDSAGGAEEEGPAFTDLLAAADLDKGAKVFGKCKACHKLEPGVNATGPSLYGVVNRAVGTEAGYGYSGKMAAVAETWTPDNLNAFLEKPKAFAPGTAMSFAGLKKETDRANVIAYLDSLDD
jgi:cytochrome c